MQTPPIIRLGEPGKGPRELDASARPKFPLSCPSGLYGLKGRCSTSHQPIDRPWRRTGGWRAEFGSQVDAGLVDPGRPAVIAPPFSHGCDNCRVLDLLGDAFHDEVESVSREAQRASRIASEISPLPSLLSGLEPEGAIDPKRADSGDVRTAVLIDCRQPTGVPIGSASTGGLGHPLFESFCDSVPVQDWKSVEVGQVLGFVRRSSESGAVGHRCCHSALPAPLIFPPTRRLGAPPVVSSPEPFGMIVWWSSASVSSRLESQISRELEPSMRLSAGQVRSSLMTRSASSKLVEWFLDCGLPSVATVLRGSSWRTTCTRPGK